MDRSTDPALLIDRARQGDRRALARAITLVEDQRAGDRTLLAAAYRSGGGARITGITGAPGAGKSTLTNELIRQARAVDREIAVLAIDPSSPFTGGAILGDRVRMQDHIEDDGVFIRSMASRGHLGGVAAATPKVVALLDGVGFPEIIVETVGVGQAEVEIAGNADTTIVVLTPGWGDSIQAAKAGLLEIGDVFVVNKADWAGVNDTVRQLKQMLELGGEDGWWPPVVTTVATTGEGIDELWDEIAKHRAFLDESSGIEQARAARALQAVDTAITEEVEDQLEAFRSSDAWPELSRAVVARDIDPWSAAAELLER